MPPSFNRFFEPFLGSGAAYLSLRPRSAILGDINEELINFYFVLAGAWRELYETLTDLSNERETYYRIRATRPRSAFRRAVRFYYLNRTCFNGIFRTNLRGEFNVPFGNNGRRILPDSDQFEKVAGAFSESTLLRGDFEITCSEVARNDLVFFDPPYTVAHANNGFIKYNSTLFAWSDQERLKLLVDDLTKKGAYVVVTNASHDSIRRLYRAYEVTSFERPSRISAAPHGRRNVTELVITNFVASWDPSPLASLLL